MLHHPRPLHRIKDEHRLNSSVYNSKAKGHLGTQSGKHPTLAAQVVISGS